MKIALYFSENEPRSVELLAEAMLAIKFKKYDRAEQILNEVLEIIKENKEVSEQ